MCTFAKSLECGIARQMFELTYLLLCLVWYQAGNGYCPLLPTDPVVGEAEDGSREKDWCYFYVLPWFIVSCSSFLLLLTLVMSSLSRVCVISIVRVTFLQNTSTDITCKKIFSFSALDPRVYCECHSSPFC
jgi:hypothetical protein